jgi:Domain of unknown function (DUF4136)
MKRRDPAPRIVGTSVPQACWLLASFLLLAGCETSKPTIRANTDPSANLAAYHTYSFAANPGTNRGGYSTPLTSYFQDAIRREMDTRGYKYVEAGGDLIVNFNANARENVDIESTPGPAVGYYGYRGGMYGGAIVESPDIQTVRYKVGTVNVDIVDANRKQLLWEGIAEGRLTDQVMKNPQGAVSAVVTEMFTRFPGRSGA